MERYVWTPSQAGVRLCVPTAGVGRIIKQEGLVEVGKSYELRRKSYER